MAGKKMRLFSLIALLTLFTTYLAVQTYEKLIDYKDPGETVFTVIPGNTDFTGALKENSWFFKAADTVLDFFSPTKLLVPVLVIFPDDEIPDHNTQDTKDLEQAIDQTAVDPPQSIDATTVETSQPIKKPGRRGTGSGSWKTAWKISAYDENKNYGAKGNIADVDIFSTSKKFDSNKLIYPGISGNYFFTVDNSYNEYNIKYSVSFSVEDTTVIPMVYRLKNKDGYLGIKSQWYTIEELNTLVKDLGLKKKEKLPYTLEWKWPESENDNQYIQYGSQKYTLNITVYAQASGY